MNEIMTDQQARETLDTNEAKNVKLFEEIKEHWQDMKSANTQLHLDQQEYENYYNMVALDDSTQTKKFGRKFKHLTISPDIRNKILGAVRLLIATDPQFSLDDNSGILDQAKKDNLEECLNRWWIESGRAVGRPIHYDMVLSALLYGEMHTACTPYKDLVKMASATARKRVQLRYDIAPTLFESWNPKTADVEMDKYGLGAYHRVMDTTVMNLRNDFGSILPENISGMGRYSKVKLHYFCDLEYVCHAVDDTPIWISKHGLTEIPVSVTMVDGSRLFEKPEFQRQPMAYALMKSGMYDKQNVILSIIYSTIFGLGVTAQFKHWSLDGTKLNVDWDNPNGVIELAIDPATGNKEDFQQVQIKPLAEDLWNVYKMTAGMVSESTINAQALGAAVDRVTTFSEMSLLNQSGRLPLITAQRMGSEGISKLMQLAIMMIKDTNESYDSNGIKLSPADLPDGLSINTKLQVNLAQDQLSLSTIASTLKDRGLLSDEFIQSNFLNVNNTTKMRKEILRGQAGNLIFMEVLKKKLMELNPPPEQDPNAMPTDTQDPAAIAAAQNTAAESQVM